MISAKSNSYFPWFSPSYFKIEKMLHLKRLFYICMLIFTKSYAQTKHYLTIDAALVPVFSSLAQPVNKHTFYYKGVSNNILSNYSIGNNLARGWGLAYAFPLKRNVCVGMVYKQTDLMNELIVSSGNSMGMGGFSLPIRELGLSISKNWALNPHSGISLLISPGFCLLKSVAFGGSSGSMSYIDPATGELFQLTYAHRISIDTEKQMAPSLSFAIQYHSKLSERRTLSFFIEPNFMLQKVFFVSSYAQDSASLILQNGFYSRSATFSMHWLRVGTAYTYGMHKLFKRQKL